MSAPPAAGANYWRASAPAAPPRAALAASRQADVVIVGAGFTGLWTAYYLSERNPALSIVVLEARRVGHGASGRNGGWVVGSLAGLARLVEGLAPGARAALCAQLADNVDQIGRVLAAEGIAADFNKAGILEVAARYPEQRARALARRSALLEAGHAAADCQWLAPAELAAIATFRGASGALWFRQAATVHPVELLHGLAAVLEARGVVIHEHSPGTLSGAAPRALRARPQRARARGGAGHRGL